MVTTAMATEAKEFIRANWKDSAEDVISACEKQKKFNGYFNEFLDYCTQNGGDWGGMVLTGIRELYPDVWDAIPERMGRGGIAFMCLCYVLVLCGVDTSK